MHLSLACMQGSEYSCTLMHKTPVGIIGASGYSGIEATHILAAHEKVELRLVTSDRWQGEAVSRRLGIMGPTGALRYAPLDKSAELARECAVVLLATPAESSLNMVPRAARRGRAGDRSLRRLPPPGSGHLPGLLRLHPLRARAARAGRLRSAGARTASGFRARGWWPTRAATPPPAPCPWRPCSRPGCSTRARSSSTRPRAPPAPAARARRT